MWKCSQAPTKLFPFTQALLPLDLMVSKNQGVIKASHSIKADLKVDISKAKIMV